jgi:hypothetical protein
MKGDADASQFQNFREKFHNFTHCSLLDHQSWARLPQVLRKMVSKNAHRCAQSAENRNGFDFSERYKKDVYESLKQVLRVTGDKTWVSLVNGAAKEL